MKPYLLMLLIVAGPTYAVEYGGIVPDPQLTPGVAIPGITKAQVCKPGYAKSVRNVTASVKMKVYREYGLKGPHDGYCKPHGCEVDHLISLELGGSNDIKNLWPQPYSTNKDDWDAHAKDKAENQAHKDVCAGSLELAWAQHQISTDWRVLYGQLNDSGHYTDELNPPGRRAI